MKRTIRLSNRNIEQVIKSLEQSVLTKNIAGVKAIGDGDSAKSRKILEDGTLDAAQDIYLLKRFRALLLKPSPVPVQPSKQAPAAILSPVHLFSTQRTDWAEGQFKAETELKWRDGAIILHRVLHISERVPEHRDVRERNYKWLVSYVTHGGKIMIDMFRIKADGISTQMPRDLENFKAFLQNTLRIDEHFDYFTTATPAGYLLQCIYITSEKPIFVYECSSAPLGSEQRFVAYSTPIHLDRANAHNYVISRLFKAPTLEGVCSRI